MDLIRTGLDTSVGRWKALLIAFCVFSAVVMGIEGAAAISAFARGSEGLLGVKGESVMHDGRVARVVRAFEPWSLAPMAGVRRHEPDAELARSPTALDPAPACSIHPASKPRTQ